MVSQPSYMTLSHCWGDEEFLTFKTETQQKLREEIHVSELAQTFQDAIRIALELGAQYIVRISITYTSVILPKKTNLSVHSTIVDRLAMHLSRF